MSTAAFVARSPQTAASMSRPAWFRRSHVQTTIVCGPPGSGKSTYVRKRAFSGDLVVCFDTIADEMFGRQGNVRARAGLGVDQIADVLRRRNELIAQLFRPKAADRWIMAWLTLSEPIGQHRQWWHDTLGASVTLLTTPAHECLRRIEADAAAGDDRGNGAKASVDMWWHSFTPAACDRAC
ncbi:AAA family ATPase [Methylocella sp.]|uniref:AAA family ATPase n=1 Tax=Methylocella sp. TaxID=1978226 RepID=UPI0037832A3F